MRLVPVWVAVDVRGGHGGVDVGTYVCVCVCVCACVCVCVREKE